MKITKTTKASLSYTPKPGLEQELIKTVSKELNKGNYQEDAKFIIIRIQLPDNCDNKTYYEACQAISSIIVDINDEKNECFESFNLFSRVFSQNNYLTFIIEKINLVETIKLLKHFPHLKLF